MRKRITPIPLVTILLLQMGTSVSAENVVDDLLAMSMEELMTIDVSIATKDKKPLSTTAAPVFVISADDIRRSGAANIPEALRMAPGLQVSQVDPHNWAVTIRGFNELLANKLLVLVDGRSIYSGFNSGTYWSDVQGMPLETIERIEIIRGPGGTIWGANAVNGVINIITRSALTTKTTKDRQLVAGGGTAQQGFSRFDATQKINDNTSVRGYGSYFNVADVKGLNNFTGDGGSGWSSGARFDWDNKQGDAVMIDANWFENSVGTSVSTTILAAPYHKTVNQLDSQQGGHFLTRWEHHVNEKNHWALRAYYDYAKHNNALLNVKTDTFDIDFTHYFSLDERNNITWGGGYRRVNDDIGNTITLTVNPAIGHSDIYNLFAQDDISLDAAKKWHLTLGSKVSYYSLTRFEVEPMAALSWRINDQHTLWTSISHAVRTPSRTQSDISVLLLADSATPALVSGKGKKGIDAENETAYQIGWRGALNTDLTVDATAFYAHYNDITRIERAGGDGFNNSLGFPAYFIYSQVGNNLNAQTYGAELSLSYQATDWWRNYLSYSFFELQAQASIGHNLTSADADEKATPQHQVSLRTNFNINSDTDFDLWWRYTDAITVNERAINDYLNLDARLAWRPIQSVELSLIGQNLIQTRHIEHQDEPLTVPQTTYVPRGVYAKINWQF